MPFKRARAVFSLALSASSARRRLSISPRMVLRIKMKLAMITSTAARLTAMKVVAERAMVPSKVATPQEKFFSVYLRMRAKLSRAFMALGVMTRS